MLGSFIECNIHHCKICVKIVATVCKRAKYLSMFDVLVPVSNFFIISDRWIECVLFSFVSLNSLLSFLIKLD